MAQLEDLANTAVSKTQIMDAFHPFVLAARRIMGQRTPSLSSPGDSESGPVSVAADLAAGTNTFSLAKAAIAEVLSSAEGSSNPSFRILRKRLATQPNQQPGVLSSSVGNPTENVISPVSSQQTEAAPSSGSDTSLSIADHITTGIALQTHHRYSSFSLTHRHTKQMQYCSQRRRRRRRKGIAGAVAGALS